MVEIMLLVTSLLLLYVSIVNICLSKKVQKLTIENCELQKRIFNLHDVNKRLVRELDGFKHENGGDAS